jgi:NAD(P)-dependent dehydrogenase (short-subunit alcohol dehydrogenase family)
MSNDTAGRNEVEQDPRKQGPTPPLPEPDQSHPGTEGEMATKADHGETSYEGSGKLKSKVALITGADSGIGKAVAIAYAREGADVAISYLSEEEGEDARDTAKWVEEAGRKALLLPGDISEQPHCKQLIERTVQELGRIDILVNNAAFQMSRQDISEVADEEFDFTFRTNIYAMFYLCKAAIPHMEAGSSIINTSSIQAYQPSPDLLAYAATKGAIVNFTKGLAQMVAKQGIRVNSVAPGPIWTPLIPATMPDEKVENFGKQVPLQRPGQPAELAPAYVMLASQDASYITAAVIPVTGGQPTM